MLPLAIVGGIVGESLLVGAGASLATFFGIKGIEYLSPERKEEFLKREHDLEEAHAAKLVNLRKMHADLCEESEKETERQIDEAEKAHANALIALRKEEKAAIIAAEKAEMKRQKLEAAEQASKERMKDLKQREKANKKAVHSKKVVKPETAQAAAAPAA